MASGDADSRSADPSIRAIPSTGTRRAYWRGVCAVAVARVRGRTVGGGGRQTALAIGGVAVAVALVLLVTSVSMGLASQGLVHGRGVDAWVVPDERASSVVTDVADPGFADAHATAAGLAASEGVRSATPVRTAVVRVRIGDGATRRVFLVGVVPDGGERERSVAGGGERSVAGVATAPLAPGDPYYADGEYDGRWTGEAVVSARGARDLGVSAGATLTPVGRAGTVGDGGRRADTASGADADRSVTVVAVDDGGGRPAGGGDLPVVVVHLAEAQRIAGGTGTDHADQFLLRGRERGAPAPARRPPGSRVLARDDPLAYWTHGSSLPLALGVAATVVAGVVGTLFVLTTVGFELLASADDRAVLAAVGVSRRTRAALVTVETLVASLLGGLFGTLAWLLLSVGGNHTLRWFGVDPVVLVRPELVPYGLVVAVGIGVLATPPVLALTRGSTLEALPAR